MLVKVLLLVCLLQVANAGSWMFIGQGCVGAKSQQFKEIAHIGPSRLIGAMKLVHRSGFVGCFLGARSNWGCQPRKTSLIMVVTDTNNQIIYPSPRQVKVGSAGEPGRYKLPGYTSSSRELVFTDFCFPKYLKKNQKLRIWYGEDLTNYTEHDNHGSTCMDIYAYFM